MESRPWTVLVVVPARDEAERLPACLAALRQALIAWGGGFRIVVVDDASSDATAVLARGALAPMGDHAAVVRGAGTTVGRARSVGVIQAVLRWTLPHDRTWVLSTDADSVVPEDWVVRHLTHARAGATAVAGVVELLRDRDIVLVDQAWRRDYIPTIRATWHPHVHATNLGIRLDAYVAVGGFGDLARGEDRDLWARLRARGHEPVADVGLVVATSGRLKGRVPDGFAGALRRLLGAGVAS